MLPVFIHIKTVIFYIQKQKPVKPIAIVKPIMAMNNRVTSWSMGQNRRRMQELLSAGNEIRPLIHFDNDPYDSGDEGGILGLYREGQAQVAARRAFNRTIRQQWGVNVYINFYIQLFYIELIIIINLLVESPVFSHHRDKTRQTQT